MSGSDKRTVRLDWQRGTYCVIVATVALGMGINKADVFTRRLAELVVTVNVQNAFYFLALDYTHQDLKCILDLGSADTDGNGRANPSLDYRKKAAAIGNFCEEKEVCRRVLLMRHFGEEFDTEDCGNTCDNCANRDIFVSRDVSEEARSAVALVQTVETKHENITIRQCVEVFRGRDTVDTRKNERCRNPHYGAGSSLSHDLATLVFDKLLKLDLLVECKVNRSASKYHYYVKTGTWAKMFLEGNQQVSVTFHSTKTLTAAPKHTYHLADLGSLSQPDASTSTSFLAYDSDLRARWNDKDMIPEGALSVQPKMYTLDEEKI
ncbi:hypothetical protein C8R46DRAFT_1281549 [Mycena filopes]|nr:hypothetical protein C8R46DRAFT_1281549 [Mycena filopes]